MRRIHVSMFTTWWNNNMRSGHSEINISATAVNVISTWMHKCTMCVFVRLWYHFHQRLLSLLDSARRQGLQDRWWLCLPAGESPPLEHPLLPPLLLIHTPPSLKTHMHQFDHFSAEVWSYMKQQDNRWSLSLKRSLRRGDGDLGVWVKYRKRRIKINWLPGWLDFPYMLLFHTLPFPDDDAVFSRISLLNLNYWISSCMLFCFAALGRAKGLLNNYMRGSSSTWIKTNVYLKFLPNLHFIQK